MSDITIIVTASPVKSHPRFTMIKKVVESLSCAKCDGGNAYKVCPIILAHDGPQPMDEPSFGTIEAAKEFKRETYWDYDRYLDGLTRWANRFDNIEVVKRPDYGNLIGNIAHALEQVKTPYVFIVQHDLPFIRSFDLTSILKDMKANPQLKHIRFNRQRNDLAKGKNFDAKDREIFGKELRTGSNVYTYTCAWSDNNHICRANYYREIILPECGDVKRYMETIINPKSTAETHSHYGTFIYGHNRHERMIANLNGREKDNH